MTGKVSVVGDSGQNCCSDVDVCLLGLFPKSTVTLSSLKKKNLNVSFLIYGYLKTANIIIIIIIISSSSSNSNNNNKDAKVIKQAIMLFMKVVKCSLVRS